MRLNKEWKEVIVDTGGAESLMPLKYAQKYYRNLIEPISDLANAELVMPDGSLMTELTHQLIIPINEIKTMRGGIVICKPGNVKFLLGRNVPFMALSKAAIRSLELWNSLETMDTCGEEPGISVKVPRHIVSPNYANVPSWLSDTKWNILKKLHNDDDIGHLGEQRTYALAKKRFPEMEITRSDVREFIRYCSKCQKKIDKKFDVPHAPIEDMNLNMMISDVWFIGDVEEDDKKLALLAVMDLKSRYIILEEIDDATTQETALKLLKIGAIFNFKECILRTDPGTNFTGQSVQSLLQAMRATWKVGAAGNHVEQSHIERGFKELNSHLRPILASLTAKPFASRMKIRIGAYLANRIYNNSINHMGFAPAQMFTPSETLELQIADEGLRESDKSELVRQILDLQQEVLSKMLHAQQKLYDQRLDDWTKEGKAAWDELLKLDIDDYVMINYPKNQKLNYSNIGPYKVIQMIDKEFFVVVQSLIDPNIKIRVKANKLIRFNYDKRCGQKPMEIQAEDKRQAVVVAIIDHSYPGGIEKFKGEKGQRQQLTFLVKFATGEQWMNWEEVKYLEALDAYLDSGKIPRAVANKLRTKEKHRKISGPIFTLVWKESFDNAFMTKPDGVVLEQVDDYRGNLDSIRIGGSPDQIKKVKELIKEYEVLFQNRRPGHFVRYDLVKYTEKDNPEQSMFGKRWEHPRKIYDPRAMAACLEILKELEEAKTIEEIPSEDDSLEWNIPINMVIDKYVEKDGERVPIYRLCFDSRAPNSIKKSEPFPAVSVEDIFQSLAGKEHQSIMDVPKAFFLMEVDKASRKYSSFTHPGNGKRYWFRGMVMGDVNSPTHLQTFMQRVFMRDKPYMDDLAIGDETFEQHLAHLRETFQQCKDNGVLLSPKKCCFNMKSLKVLGRVTDKEWRKVDDETISRIKNYAKPYTIKHLMAFNGLVNWMRDYLPNLGEKMQPLYALTQIERSENEETDVKKKYRYILRTKIQWTPELTALFEEVKVYCSNPVNLYYIDPSRPVFVNTDASLKGWGGIVYQLDDEGNKRICGIKSGSWNKVQAKWPTVEQEAYAIYRTIIDFEYCLVGRPFTLYTDSQNLTFLKESPSRKIQRWRLALQMFTFQCIHVAGEKNVEADSLSRVSFSDSS